MEESQKLANPYEAPAIPSSLKSPDLVSDNSKGIFRFRDNLVVDIDSHVFPDVCFKTSVATKSRKETTAMVPNAGATIASMAMIGVAGVLAAKYLFGSKVSLAIPLSPEIGKKITEKNNISLVGVALGVVLMCGGTFLILMHDAFALLAILGLVLILTSLVKHYLNNRYSKSPFAITTSRGKWYFITGVNKDVLSSLPEWKGVKPTSG